MNKIITPLFLYALVLSINGCSSNNTTTGFIQEIRTEIPINSGSSRSGKQIYDYRCKTCHDRNTQGAPMPGDEYEWQLRAEKGFDVLLKHTIEGFNRGRMPARGGCRNCNDEELRNAVVYMLQNSGIQLENVE